MNTATTSPHLLQHIFTAQSASVYKNIVAVAAGIAALTISAKVQIPAYPVPFTLQTLVVLLLGMAYGYKLAVSTVISYLIIGAVGVSVFAGTPAQGIGLAYMFGPTGGYLFGFVIATAACGLLAQRGWDKTLPLTIAAMLVGNIIIYACGLAWLGTLIGWDKPILALGMVPFLLGDIIKTAIAAVLMPALWKVVQKSDSRT